MEIKNVSVAKAAAILGKSEQFVRCGLIAGILPFGTAVKVKGKYSYHISPKLFIDYTGCTVEKLRGELLEQ